MRKIMLGLAASVAASALPAAPAQAQAFAGETGFAAGSGVTVHRDFVSHDRRDRRRNRGRTVFFGDREYQGDTVWRSDSFNDWWHERPHRSHPAWMSRNDNC